MKNAFRFLVPAALAAATLAAAPAYAADPATSAPPAAAASVQPMTADQLLGRQAQHDSKLFVLDVRTPEEFAAGHVPGAVNVPHDQVAARMSEIPKDKDVVLYCKSGRRAGIAAGELAAHGYTRLSHLEGDMNAWTEQGRPIQK